MLEQLTGTVQPYAWGSRTVLPRFLGREPNGEPQAELWLGSHPVAPSSVLGRPLGEVVAAQPERVLGRRAVARFGSRLPYLLKVLAPAQPLSLQVHPSRAQAVAGFAREEALGVPTDAPHRMYRDDWPKPELYCALTRTEVLCGFRRPAATYELLQRLNARSLMPLVEPLQAGGVEQLGRVFERLLRHGGAADLIRDVVSAAASVTDGEPPLLALARTAHDLGKLHPRDPGVLAALLLNRLTLDPGDALFLPAGNVHAYLSGHGVEIMANSDNVVRVGLTSKYVNIDELLSLVDFSPELHCVVDPVEESAGVWAYRTPTPEFAMWRLEVRQAAPVTAPGAGSGRIALVTRGAVTLQGATSRLALCRGESSLLAAEVDPVRVSGDGTVFVAGPGH